MLFIAMVYMIGDKLKISSDVSTLKEIPFISGSYLGKWNLKQGTISLEQIPPGYANTQTDAQPKSFPFEIIRKFDNNLTIKLSIQLDRIKSNEAIMEIKGVKEEKVKLLADTGKYANFILSRPIDVQIKMNEILSYWEFTYSNNKYGILSCNYKPDSIVWTVITDQLNISVSENGSRMAVSRDMLYIAYPSGSIYTLNLLNGKLIEETQIEKKIRDFIEDFAFNSKVTNPLDLVPYRNHMIINWKPLTPNPTLLILLLWQNQIIDSIESNGTNLTIRKGETVTFTSEITLKELDPANWIFTPNLNP